MKGILLFLLSFSFLHVFAQPANTEKFRQKTITLRRFLEMNHYQPLQWNDSSSVRLYNKWLKELDDEKLFFTAADIAILEPLKMKLDDELMGKGWDFFSRSVALYKIRLQKTDSIIQAVLAKPFDLSQPDNFTWPYASFASSLSDQALRWQRFLRWRVMETIIDKLTDQGKTATETLPADLAKLEVVAREKIKRQERGYINGLLKIPPAGPGGLGFSEAMEDEYLNAIAWCYDPHTTYMNNKEKDEFDSEVSASEYSSGFDLAENEKGDIAISYLQPGGSAWRSGQLHKGDVLLKIKVDGIEKDVADIDSDEEAEKLLGGNSNSDIEITVRTQAGEIKTVKLSKEKISAEESIVKSYVLRGSKNIGYINLPGFYSREESSLSDDGPKYDGCANDMSKEIVKLKKDSIAGLILDLRFNGGGSMWEAMQLAGIFIDIGPVASVKDKTGKVHFLKDPNRGTIYDGPLLVLVNGASASASEFVSAVLQDYNRAIIAGGSTYGKGTAQVVLPMDTLNVSTKNDEDFVKVTQQKFYRVNGSTTQWKGVVPDIALPDMYADESFKEKSNSSALQPDNSRTGIYQPLAALPIASLKAKSESRVANDPYFKLITAFSEWIRSSRTGMNVSLQWGSYVNQYKKAREMFVQFSKDEHPPTAISAVSNNGFDSERLSLSSMHSRSINDTYLKEVKKDMTIAEAYNIMMDWIGK